MLNEKELVEMYLNGSGIYDLCSHFKIGKIKVKDILSKNNIEIRKKGGQIKKRDLVVSDYKVEKYSVRENKHYIAKFREDGKEFNDYMNNGGYLTSYIKEKLGIETPTLYDRRIYYMETGSYWWEQWFDIIERDDLPTKKCPYCDWETIDIDNKSGWFEQHLKKEHNISKEKYLNEYPNEREYFRLVNKTLDIQMEKDEDKFVICQICGKKLKRIDWKHLNKHNISLDQYKKEYSFKTMATIYFESNKNRLLTYNINGKTVNYVSKAEKEICEYLKNKNLIVKQSDRKILHGKELDIYIPSLNIAIEYNGNRWHTEWFANKDKNSHLNKTIECENNGVKLIHIFEDEYVSNKEMVLDKISHILHLDNNKEKIFARKCNIKPIYNKITDDFLNNNHIQGTGQYSLSLGAYYNDELMAVMTFREIKKGDYEYDLTRFVTNIKYNVIGVGGKLFNYFIENYKPMSVISFADRRWTLDKDNNVYTKMGFKLVNTLSPDYKYYNKKIDKYKRFHKFRFRKEKLHKKYGFPLTMTETEMVKELGYDRIWDCGLFKYEWKPQKKSST
jgi:hypothetical protein